MARGACWRCCSRRWPSGCTRAASRAWRASRSVRRGGRPLWAPRRRGCARCRSRRSPGGSRRCFYAEPRRYALRRRRASRAPDAGPAHVLLVLDVSPSMRLVDAGPTRSSRAWQRARDVMESFFDRVPFDEFRVSVVAVYNGAKPVVIDTKRLRGRAQHPRRPADAPRVQARQDQALRRPRGGGEDRQALESAQHDARDRVRRRHGARDGMPRMPPSVIAAIVVGVGDPRRASSSTAGSRGRTSRRSSRSPRAWVARSRTATRTSSRPP
jgi:hypothetical protein